MKKWRGALEGEAASAIGIWNLGFGISLGFGTWTLDIHGEALG
jgi:hypothetical protein